MNKNNLSAINKRVKIKTFNIYTFERKNYTVNKEKCLQAGVIYIFLYENSG